MLMPPVLAYLRFGRFRAWLPVFLAWPLLSLLEMLLVPVCVIVGAVALPWMGWRWSRAVALAVPGLMELFAAMRGLLIDVGGRGGRVVIRFI
ncbi:MAG TPA: hypothetical protein ENN09_03320 [Planctomycetes bacterium]|nr:hypothetical protein [Planctomycetota bacterium]